MINPGDVWAFLGMVTLTLMLYKDIKTLRVDSRRNYFMIGATIALLATNNMFILYFITFLVVLLLGFFIHRLEARHGTRILGDGDREALLWLVPGFFLLGGQLYPLMFLVFFMAALGGTGLAKKFLNVPLMPGVTHLTVAFVLTLTIFWGIV